MLDVDSYDQLQAAFSWDHYRDACDWDARDELNLGHETIGRHAGEDALALIWVAEDGHEERYTFADLDHESDRFANLLTGLGVDRGTRVVTHLPRTPEHYVAILGTLKTGAIFGAINERYGVDGVRHRLADSRASIVLTTPTNRQKIERAVADLETPNEIVVVDRDSEGVPADCIDYHDRMDDTDASFDTVRTAPDDPALLYYTSGTTGPAKGVLHGHRFAVANAAFVDNPLGVRDGDLYWLTADPGWLTGLNAFGAWFWGVPNLIYAGEFDVHRWADVLDEYPITHLWSVPTAFRLLKDHDDVLDDVDVDLETVLSIGEPLNAPVIEWARERFGVDILDAYGTSETYGTIVSNFSFMTVKPGSMGRPYPGIDIHLVEPGTTEPVSPGEPGEILVREFPSAFLRYWEREAETAAVRSGDWIHTDDLATRDDDGYFWFQGRTDDVILSAGYRIGPFDIESTLVDHDAIAEAAVVPKPDDERGNVVVAFVVLSDGVTPSDELTSDIKSFVKDHLAAHEYPREIEYVDELPHTVTGKIRRTELRDRV
ncbi:acyl-CoA synthetase [Halorubellus salinus]|uniref:acyl-CoA synthetase n=1 Tax=Halorubellus salinus TaxID=755309 RepID=UPI001D076104|nr:AMP-binding protein [Halorubellus salinus]